MQTSRRRDPMLREEVFIARHPSGLEILVVPKRGIRKKAAVLATRYGSIDVEFTPPGGKRTRTPAGVAHFLEHQLFKKPDGDRLVEFGRTGASANAFTDYGLTAYHFTGTDAFEENLDRLVDFVTHPWFVEENVTRERSIIEQELRMYRDMPDYRTFQNLAGILYQAHPVRLEIGGTIESIQEITAETLRLCYGVFYHPANLTLILVGDFPAAEVLRRAAACVDKALGTSAAGDAASAGEGRGAAPRGAAGRPGRYAPPEPPGPVQPEIRETLTVSRPRVLVGFKDVRPPLRGNALLDEELVTSVLLNLLFGKASAAHARWYERGLIDDSFAASFNADTTYGFTLIGGETEEPERLRDEVLGAIRRARKGRFTKQEVERARRQALGHYLRAFDSSEGIAFLLLGCHLRDADLFSWPGLAKRLTARRLSERLESHLDESRCAVSFAYPREEEK